MWHVLAWVLNIPHRITTGRQRMVTRREHMEYADAVIHQRYKEMLDRMVDSGEIDPPDRERALRRMSWQIPLPISNKDFIDKVTQLQLRKGGMPGKKPSKAEGRRRISEWINATKPKQRVVRRAKPLYE